MRIMQKDLFLGKEQRQSLGKEQAAELMEQCRCQEENTVPSGDVQ